MDYTSLKQNIDDWLARNDISSVQGDFAIDLGEARINRILRIKAMERSYYQAINAGGAVPVPADYLEVKDLFLVRYNVTPVVITDAVISDFGAQTFPNLAQQGFISKLERVSEQMLYANAALGVGTPKGYARVGDHFQLVPVNTEGVYAVSGVYYARLPALVATPPDSTNWLTDNAPDLYLAASLTEAAAFAGDTAKRDYWQERFDRALGEIQDADIKEENSGPAPQMKVDGWQGNRTRYRT